TFFPEEMMSLGHLRVTDQPKTRRAAMPATRGIRGQVATGQSGTKPTDTATPLGADDHRAPERPRPSLWRWATTTAARSALAFSRARSWVEGTTSCTSNE